VASFSGAAEQRCNAWSDPAACPTALFFRERDGIATARDDWRKLNASLYRLEGMPDRVQERMSIPTFREIVSEFTLAIQDAARVRMDEALYASLVVNGIDHVRRNFSWAKAAKRYARIMEL
jgi:hypothetical protein